MSQPVRGFLNRAKAARSRPPDPFYVVTHERAGTHFLINTLQRNAVLRPRYYTPGEWNGPYASGAPSQFKHIDILRANWADIATRHTVIKSHADRALFEFRYPPAKAVYVLRDPRDTLVSFYHYLNHEAHAGLTQAAEHRGCPISEFLRRPLSPYLRWSLCLHGHGGNVVDRWARHVKGWLDADDTVVVRYEEIKTDYRGVVKRLAPFLGLALLPFMSPVALNEGESMLARKGEIGDWRGQLTADDEVLVRTAVDNAGLDWEAVTWRG